MLHHPSPRLFRECTQSLRYIESGIAIHCVPFSVKAFAKPLRHGCTVAWSGRCSSGAWLQPAALWRRPACDDWGPRSLRTRQPCRRTDSRWESTSGCRNSPTTSRHRRFSCGLFRYLGSMLTVSLVSHVSLRLVMPSRNSYTSTSFVLMGSFLQQAPFVHTRSREPPFTQRQVCIVLWNRKGKNKEKPRSQAAVRTAEPLPIDWQIYRKLPRLGG